MKTQHDIKYDGCSPHNGEYWHSCRRCGESDWIPSYGEERHLNFYDKPCVPPPDPAEVRLYDCD